MISPVFSLSRSVNGSSLFPDCPFFTPCSMIILKGILDDPEIKLTYCILNVGPAATFYPQISSNYKISQFSNHPHGPEQTDYSNELKFGVHVPLG